MHKILLVFETPMEVVQFYRVSADDILLKKLEKINDISVHWPNDALAHELTDHNDYPADILKIFCDIAFMIHDQDDRFTKCQTLSSTLDITQETKLIRIAAYE